MADPRITYNSKTINFTKAAYIKQPDRLRSTLRSTAASGKTETLNVRASEVVEFAVRNFSASDATAKTLQRNLYQWLSWAQDGSAWNLSNDSDEQVLTLLDGALSAGDTVVTVDSSTGVDASGLYVVRSLTNLELVHIASVDSGTQVTLTETLNYDYPDNSRFRSAEYWPGKLVDQTSPIIENPPMFWDFVLRFVEDVDDLL